MASHFLDAQVLFLETRLISMTMSMRPSSLRKREAILTAAADAFVLNGFDAVSMDDIAARAGVSKQTAYTHFHNKEKLFLEVIGRQTADAFDAASGELDDLDASDPEARLSRLGSRLLDAVLQPRLIALRRLVIAESRRFPELAQAFWDGGPRRTIDDLAQRFAAMCDAGLLDVPDTRTAATTFNWLLMAGPINEAMFRAEAASPDAKRKQEIVAEAVHVFLAAYGTKSRGSAAEAATTSPSGRRG
ncbi:TetR/AcrR family transcriptional regulator [Gordonia sp. (in: high G+C Gram-positive bacteria)]|uniref:TetR/AcrR family transcriptional regulator n=1 Tax=Gordonia sp. (in: high G+C Gram-positive bacteria) TaxID=84139 RepID=UPI0039E228A6